MRFNIVFLMTFLIFDSPAMAQGSWEKLNSTSEERVQERKTSVSAKSLTYYCSSPSLPYCIGSSTGAFDDEADMERCKGDVQRYLEALSQHDQCVLDETTKAAIEITKKFGCRREGKTYCY